RRPGREGGVLQADRRRSCLRSSLAPGATRGGSRATKGNALLPPDRRVGSNGDRHRLVDRADPLRAGARLLDPMAVPLECGHHRFRARVLGLLWGRRARDDTPGDLVTLTRPKGGTACLYHRKLRNGGAMPTDAVSGIKACAAAASADDLGLPVA